MRESKKVKISTFGFMDMLKFKNMASEREKVIEAASDLPLPETDMINELARIFHPREQFLKIEAVIEENHDTKTFRLVPDLKRGTTRLAPFRAGSYLNISVQFGGSVVSRVYSISSSPEESFYSITVKRKLGGFLSEYLLEQAKAGDSLTAGAPSGTFVYSALRDGKNVIAAAGGTGITPFLSMAKAIADGIEDFRLTILYGARTQRDLIFQREFQRIMERTDKVKVVYILSDEQEKGFRHGLITAELIQEYMPLEKSSLKESSSKESGSKESVSVFAAGPAAMCEYLEEELKKLSLLRKNIRIEQTGGQISCEERAEYRLIMYRKGERRELPMYSDETVLTALERSGIAAPNQCRVGHCGFCRSRLLSGEYQATKQEHLRIADQEFGYFHPCCAYPLSDMEIEIY